MSYSLVLTFLSCITKHVFLPSQFHPRLPRELQAITDVNVRFKMFLSPKLTVIFFLRGTIEDHEVDLRSWADELGVILLK